MSDQEGAAVVTFKDHTLYESDLDLLKPGQWLNDRLLGFYYDYLEDLSPNVRLVNPDAAMMIQFLSKEDVAEDMQSLGLDTVEYVLTPVNNNSDVNKAGGSHWSLLAWVKALKQFFIFDSSNGMNDSHAKAIAIKLAALVYPSAPSSWTPQKNIIIAQTPRQPNGYDCGMYVLAISEAFIHHTNKTSAFNITEFEKMLASTVTQPNITKRRGEFLELIKKLASS